MCFRAKNAGYKACLCIPSRCFRVDSSTCSRMRSSQPLPPCHISSTWWLRIGRLHTKQIAVMVLKKKEVRGLGLSRQKEAWRPACRAWHARAGQEEEGASFNDKITWNQAMPTERLKVTIRRSRGFLLKHPLKFAIVNVMLGDHFSFLFFFLSYFLHVKLHNFEKGLAGGDAQDIDICTDAILFPPFVSCRARNHASSTPTSWTRSKKLNEISKIIQT